MTSTSNPPDCEIVFIQKNTSNSSELIASIVEMDRDEFNRAWTKNDWDVFLQGPSDYLLQAILVSGSLIGYGLWKLSKAEELAHLLKLHITISSRKNGLGALVMKEAIGKLETLGFNFQYLEVEESNLPAIKLYEKYSFHIVHRKDKYYSDGKSALFMKRGLE
ncbi:MAG: GNAT family N-acetyltransferase [Bacteriovoracaceae bacterium]|nr:GNAT family N-acetyltransferase [Bacteriovoracaceae bacterium]